MLWFSWIYFSSSSGSFLYCRLFLLDVAIYLHVWSRHKKRKYLDRIIPKSLYVVGVCFPSFLDEASFTVLSPQLLRDYLQGSIVLVSFVPNNLNQCSQANSLARHLCVLFFPTESRTDCCQCKEKCIFINTTKKNSILIMNVCLCCEVFLQ